VFEQLAKKEALESSVFPGYWETDELSRRYDTVVKMGTTGWAGYGEKFWRCAYEDLTPRGKRLFNLIDDRFAEGVLRLLTFADT
jgi:hypothetical protein